MRTINTETQKVPNDCNGCKLSHTYTGRIYCFHFACFTDGVPCKQCLDAEVKEVQDEKG